MKNKYIAPKIHLQIEEQEYLLAGSVTATAPDMEGEMNCDCCGDPNKCTCGDVCDCWGCRGWESKKSIWVDYD